MWFLIGNWWNLYDLLFWDVSNVGSTLLFSEMDFSWNSSELCCFGVDFWGRFHVVCGRFHICFFSVRFQVFLRQTSEQRQTFKCGFCWFCGMFWFFDSLTLSKDVIRKKTWRSSKSQRPIATQSQWNLKMAELVVSLNSRSLLHVFIILWRILGT